MSKHHREFKLRLAQLASEASSLALELKFNVSSPQIRYWSAVYLIHGSNSFLHRTMPYSREFKFKALETMLMNNWSLGYTSAFFDLSSPGILFQWQKLYDTGGLENLTPRKKGKSLMKQRPQSKPSEQMTENELREELDYLRAENAVLKKLEALVQEKRERTKKKR